MNRIAKQLGRTLVACLFVTSVPCAEAVIVIDDFDTPGGPIAVVMPLLDGEKTLVETTSPEILGGQRDALFDIVGTTERLVGFSAEINSGSFWYDGHTPGTLAIFQYDGLDTDIPGVSPELVNSENLGGIDLTDNGHLFLFGLGFVSIDHPMNIKIEVHSTSGAASFAGTVPASPGTPTMYSAMFRDFVGDDDVFTNATSIELCLNSEAAEDIDFQLDYFIAAAPGPSTLAIWGLGIVGIVWGAIRRRRRC